MRHFVITTHVHTVSIVSNIKFLDADRHHSRRLTPCEPGVKAKKNSDTKISDKIFSDVFQSYFGRFQRNVGRIQKSMNLVIFNALKRYLKVNSFKFV